MELLHQCLMLGVGPTTSHPQVLSHAPEATSARFRYIRTCTSPYMHITVHLGRLLNLAVSILQDRNLIGSTLERTLLRERIYNTTLDFFA